MRWTRPAVALGVVVLSLGAVGVADLVAAPTPPEPDTATAGPGDAVVSGRVVCPVGDSREGTSTRLEVTQPAELGTAPARIETRRLGDDPASLAVSQIFPASGAISTLGGDGPRATAAVEWQDAPLSVARRWRVDEAEDLPPGTAAGPCPVSTAPTSWTIPGVSTTGGTEGLLRLSNPHATGATVAVRFLTPEGPEAPTRLRNLSIGSGTTEELSLNEFIPERADVTVVVEVLSGRVAAEGVQLARSAIGDVDGVSLLQASTAPAESWTIPWVADAADRDPWLWVANDDDRTARVELTVHTADGGLPAEGLSEVEIPPRTVRRIDLRGVLPEEVSAAVTVRSDGVPVHASGVVEVRTEDVDGTGLVVQRGADAAETAWTVTGGPTEARTEQLRLVNPTSAPAVVDATLWDGGSTQLPESLRGVEVPPGALVVVPLGEVIDGLDRWSLTLRARSGEFVAGTVGQGDPSGAAHWVAGIGTPRSAWSSLPIGDVRVVRGAVQRLGTSLGIGPADPFARPAGDDEDELDPAELGPDGPTVPAPGPADDATGPDVGTPDGEAPDDAAPGAGGPDDDTAEPDDG